MRITNYQAAVKYLEALPRTPDPAAEAGFNRAKQLLSLLGNPQNKLKTIHVAGTSGKGSTAMALSHILVAHGFKVGLTVSPHVYDIRERCQINNRAITTKKFQTYLSQILPVIEKLKKRTKVPTYFEALVALAFVAFAAEEVDYAIVETGMGGLLDATNTVDRDDKLCLLTKIGYDHTQILGNSLEEIA